MIKEYILNTSLMSQLRQVFTFICRFYTTKNDKVVWMYLTSKVDWCKIGTPKSTCICICICILSFIFTPSYRKYISCTLSINTKLLKLRVHNNNKRRKLGWRRAHYSKTNHGPLTRLTLFYCSFVIH